MIDHLNVVNIIESSSEVFLTAHKNIDLDALGSILGMYFIVKNSGKNAYIIIDDEDVSTEVKRSLSSIKNTDNIDVYKYSDIVDKITNDSLLIVTDNSKINRLQNIKLNDIKNKIVIDHHIRTDDNIKDCTYEFIDITASSACEIVLELIKKLNIYIPTEIANIMLSGIYIDTNGFLLKTTEKTHFYASFLYQFGVDNIEVQYLLKQNFNEFKKRQILTLATEFYNNIAISTSDLIYSSVELAKACDVLLTFNNVEACFVIGKLDDDIIGISARSLGNVDVAKIMNNFNGGGHKTDAACQIKNSNINEIKNELLNFLGGLDESNIY